MRVYVYCMYVCIYVYMEKHQFCPSSTIPHVPSCWWLTLLLLVMWFEVFHYVSSRVSFGQKVRLHDENG